MLTPTPPGILGVGQLAAHLVGCAAPASTAPSCFCPGAAASPSN